MLTTHTDGGRPNVSIDKINEVMALTEELDPCCQSLACKMYGHQLDLLDEHSAALHHAGQLFEALVSNDTAFTRRVKKAYLDWLGTR